MRRGKLRECDAGMGWTDNRRKNPRGVGRCVGLARESSTSGCGVASLVCASASRVGAGREGRGLRRAKAIRLFREERVIPHHDIFVIQCS